jgi:hypothetical protein
MAGEQLMYPIVSLSDEDIELAKSLASARNDPKEARRVRSKKMYAGRSERDTHLMGVGAEIAVARYYKVEPPMTISLSGDGGNPDFVINGWTCEVKCARQQGWDFKLLDADPNSLTADVGILVYQLKPFEYEIRGLIGKRRLRRALAIRDFGHGPKACVSPHDMSHPDLLLKNSKQLTQAAIDEYERLQREWGIPHDA